MRDIQDVDGGGGGALKLGDPVSETLFQMGAGGLYGVCVEVVCPGHVPERVAERVACGRAGRGDVRVDDFHPLEHVRVGERAEVAVWAVWGVDLEAKPLAHVGCRHGDGVLE